MEKHKAPGLAAAVLRGHQVTALGVRIFGAPEPMTGSDLMHLGSCTKAMTATLIGQLVDQKKLSRAWTT